MSLRTYGVAGRTRVKCLIIPHYVIQWCRFCCMTHKIPYSPWAIRKEKHEKNGSNPLDAKRS